MLGEVNNSTCVVEVWKTDDLQYILSTFRCLNNYIAFRNYLFASFTVRFSFG